jgi:hypothetical protein
VGCYIAGTRRGPYASLAGPPPRATGCDERELGDRRELDAADRLRHALLQHGFREAAALAGADIEAPDVEDADELDDAAVVRANFAGTDEPPKACMRSRPRRSGDCQPCLPG